MHILFINRSFYPDVEATGQLLTELCVDLARDHDVTVIAGQPNFVATDAGSGFVQREEYQGVQILRVRNTRFSKNSLVGRAFGLLSYLFLAFWAGLFVRRPDVVVVETDPPFLGPLGAFLKLRHRCRLVYYLQDLFPEVGLALGKIRPGLVATLLRWTTQLGLRAADRVVVLGEDMLQRVQARGIDPAKVAIVPNWADSEVVRPAGRDNALRKEWGLGDQFAVMYSGNLGLSQGLEHVLHAARQFRSERVQFLFVGEGAAKSRLQGLADEWNLDNVRFLSYQPKERLGESLSVADIHLIPLQQGLAGCIVPSKLYGILAAGVPYIAAVDADSEVARVTGCHETGLRIDPDAPHQLVAALRWCLHHPHELAWMGRRGRELAQTEFDRRIAVGRFQRVLDEAVASPAGAKQPALSFSTH